MDLQGATITTLGNNTQVILDGLLATFPTLQMITALEGTLPVRDQQKLQTTGNDRQRPLNNPLDALE